MQTAQSERRIGVVSLLTLFALFVHGYHPYSEDGGVYVAGVKRLLDPSLYGSDPRFVLVHLRFSVFAYAVAAIVRLSHVPLEWVLFVLYAASVWATLYAAWMLAARCTPTVDGRQGAVALLACWLTLPIAGTSLVLADPYLTARSLALPLVLAAVAGAMDAVSGRRSRARSMMAYALLAAMLLHPLMAAYGLAAVVVVALGSLPVRLVRWRSTAIAALPALAVAAGLQVAAPAESAAYAAVARTRYYWFLSEWHWYEWLGLAAPLLLLGVATRGGSAGWKLLARAGLALGTISAAVALVFAHIGYATHLVARLQPLRCFQLVYVFMILLLGMRLGERVLAASVWRWAASLIVLGTAMFAVQRSIYPASDHLELPGVAPANLYEQAFLWVRANTPKEALFALDPHYIEAAGEDAQCFRAIAERDSLPDYSKDGGEAAIAPALAGAWVAGQAEIDAARLRSMGVDWVVLRAGSSWDCPYRNGSVEVCRVPPSPSFLAKSS